MCGNCLHVTQVIPALFVVGRLVYVRWSPRLASDDQEPIKDFDFSEASMTEPTPLAESLAGDR
jgi:hypothetical protein